MRSICVVGAGYVGLVTAACFAELGNRVTCVETDLQRLAALRSGRSPFYEPGLDALLARTIAAGRLRFTSVLAEGVADADVTFIAVGTPTRADGQADLSAVSAVAIELGRTLRRAMLVVNKSTVPAETGDLVRRVIVEHLVGPHEVRVASNPEFLREGTAIADFLAPDRIVIGVSDAASEALLRDLYAPLGAPMFVTDVRTAEIVKYTANCFLATKISFINEIAKICDAVGADVTRVVDAVAADKRIGRAFLGAGLGFGGSCFPKDVRALAATSHQHGIVPRMLRATLVTNARQVDVVVEKIRAGVGTLRGRTVAVLGLAFKPNTDDVRESQALALVRALADLGAHVRAHDPVAMAQSVAALDGREVVFARDAYDAVAGAHAIVLATEWDDYLALDLARLRARMRGRTFVDARNRYDPERVRGAGFAYVGVGRGGSAAVPGARSTEAAS